MNKFHYSNDNKRYHTFNYETRKHYGFKVFKVGLNAGFTCPNRDGKVAFGGCSFCNEIGSGDFQGNTTLNLLEQFDRGVSIQRKKWPDAKAIAYFQAFTNTYAPLDQLKVLYEPFIHHPDVVALAIATRIDCLDEAIIQYMKRTYNLLIGERTAEIVKMTIGSAMPSPEEESMDIRGRDLVTGLPKTLPVSVREIELALSEPVSAIVDAVKVTLEKTPPELSADIMDRGIVMTGGGSQLRRLDKLLTKETGMPVIVAEDALDCVAKGTGIVAEDLETMKRVTMSIKKSN